MIERRFFVPSAVGEAVGAGEVAAVGDLQDDATGLLEMVGAEAAGSGAGRIPVAGSGVFGPADPILQVPEAPPDDRLEGAVRIARFAKEHAVPDAHALRRDALEANRADAVRPPQDFLSHYLSSNCISTSAMRPFTMSSGI